MRLHILLKPSAKEQKIEQSNGIFRVSVKSHPKDNEANEELIEVLAGYFGVSKKVVSLVSGFNSRNKVVEIVRGSK